MEKLFSNWEETRKKLIAEHKSAWERLNKEKAKYKTREEWKVAQLNKQKGNLNKFDGFNCEKCNNRGGSFYLDENNNEVFKRCECVKSRNTLAKLNKIGISAGFKEKTLENFKCDSFWQETIFIKAENFIKDPQKNWFYFGGQSGTGKTHICTAILVSFLKKDADAYYMPWRDDITKLKSVVFNEPVYRTLIKNLKTIDVLYIDDLFKTGKDSKGKLLFPTSQEVNIAYEIINARYANKKTTIFSSELILREIFDIDEAIGSRIYEMCGKGVFCYNLKRDPTKNYRNINFDSIEDEAISDEERWRR